MERATIRDQLRASHQRDWYEPPIGEISPDEVYNKLPAIPIEGTPTSETCRQADRLYKSYKEHPKRIVLQKLLHAAKRALYHGGCVRYSRDRESPDCSVASLQIVDCAVEAGLFEEHRSPPGSPKMSRLLPMPELARFTEVDPWEFDPNENTQYVSMRDRETKNEIKFDPTHPTAVRYQNKLRRINKVIAQFDIFYRPVSASDCFETRRQLRSVHYARFTDNFDLHGRIYTGHYGHQPLRKIERQTIEFETEPHYLEPSVELDYSGLHPRLVYHLAGIDYQRDPYALWGNATTKPMRLMAKTLINAALNASCYVNADEGKGQEDWQEQEDSQTGKSAAQSHSITRCCEGNRTDVQRHLCTSSEKASQDCRSILQRRRYGVDAHRFGDRAQDYVLLRQARNSLLGRSRFIHSSSICKKRVAACDAQVLSYTTGFQTSYQVADNRIVDSTQWLLGNTTKRRC
jgi:hypothetical protein